MKLAGIVITALALNAGAAGVTGAEPGLGRCFMDADNNGICDYVHGSCSYADTDGDGFCDNCGISIDGNRYCWGGAGGSQYGADTAGGNGYGSSDAYTDSDENGNVYGYGAGNACPQYNEGCGYGGNGGGHHGRHHR